MGKMSIPKAEFVKGDALKIAGSTGKEKQRIRFKVFGKDDKLHLVACEKFAKDELGNEPPKLNFIEKNFWFVARVHIDGKKQWVKINKNSFCKRFNIEKDALRDQEIFCGEFAEKTHRVGFHKLLVHIRRMDSDFDVTQYKERRFKNEVQQIRVLNSAH